MRIRSNIVEVVFDTRFSVVHKLDEGEIRDLGKVSKSCLIKTLNDNWDSNNCRLFDRVEAILLKHHKNFLDDVDAIEIEVPLGFLQLDVESRGRSGSDFPLVVSLQKLHVLNCFLEGGNLKEAISCSAAVIKSLPTFDRLDLSKSEIWDNVIVGAFVKAGSEFNCPLSRFPECVEKNGVG